MNPVAAMNRLNATADVHTGLLREIRDSLARLVELVEERDDDHEDDDTPDADDDPVTLEKVG